MSGPVPQHTRDVSDTITPTAVLIGEAGSNRQMSAAGSTSSSIRTGAIGRLGTRRLPDYDCRTGFFRQPNICWPAARDQRIRLYWTISRKPSPRRRDRTSDLLVVATGRMPVDAEFGQHLPPLCGESSGSMVLAA